MKFSKIRGELEVPMFVRALELFAATKGYQVEIRYSFTAKFQHKNRLPRYLSLSEYRALIEDLNNLCDQLEISCNISALDGMVKVRSSDRVLNHAE